MTRPARVIRRTASIFYRDSCTTYAAAIAYYAVFSFVPLALIIISILGFALDREDIAEFIFEQVPLEQTPEVREDVDRLVGRALDFSWASLSIGALTLIWSASGVFGGVRGGLHAASQEKKHRPFWQSKLIDLALIPALGGLLIMTVWISSAVERLSEVGPIDLEWTLAVRLVTFMTAAGVAFVMFLLLYRFIPAARPAWGQAVIGAVFATVAFELAKQLWVWAAARILNWEDAAVYAGLGYAAGGMLWVYVNAVILLLGSEFGRAVAEEWRGAPVAAPATPPQAAPARAR
ncbi:MAG: YihY/virulence factor BrkB family protein [Dehalococcoidia bacterium]